MKSSKTKNLNIAVICGDLNPDDLGGAEVHIVEVIKLLAFKGHRMHVFVGNDDRIKSILHHPHIFVHVVPYYRIKNLCSLIYIFACIRILNIFLKHQQIDILHAKQTFPYGVSGAYISKKYKLPLYITVQNPYSYKEELILLSKFIPKKILAYLQGFLKPFAKYALKNAEVAACVSSYSEKLSRQLGARHTAIVPNGVDTGIFYPELKKKYHHPWITTTSTLIPRNGVDTLIKAFSHCLCDYPDLRLKIAGIGPLREELDLLISQLGIRNNVDFLGTLTREQVPKLLSKSLLFVRPSRYEGFGVSFIEAMACGIPVIATPIGGIVDFIFHNKTGVLVHPDDAYELADAMKSLIADKKRYSLICKNALRLVKDRYSWQSIANKVEMLYYEIVS